MVDGPGQNAPGRTFSPPLDFDRYPFFNKDSGTRRYRHGSPRTSIRSSSPSASRATASHSFNPVHPVYPCSLMQPNGLSEQRTIPDRPCRSPVSLSNDPPVVGGGGGTCPKQLGDLPLFGHAHKEIASQLQSFHCRGAKGKVQASEVGMFATEVARDARRVKQGWVVPLGESGSLQRKAVAGGPGESRSVVCAKG